MVDRQDEVLLEGPGGPPGRPLAGDHLQVGRGVAEVVVGGDRRETEAGPVQAGDEVGITAATARACGRARRG